MQGHYNEPGSGHKEKRQLVVAWIEIHKDDLLADWTLTVNGRKPFPIRGLDQ
jgi:hypothetical protein